MYINTVKNCINASRNPWLGNNPNRPNPELPDQKGIRGGYHVQKSCAFFVRFPSTMNKDL